MPQTIIVSYRLPVTVKKVDGKLEYYPSSGGLATGMASFTKSKSNIWVGYPGIPSEELTIAEKKAIYTELEKDHCHPVFLNKRQMDEFYNGYSNSILWPLLHGLPPELENEEQFYDTYREVNKLYALTITSLSDSKSMLWVHDYQLMLLPKMLRQSHPDSTVGFFMHIPFPKPKAFIGLKNSPSLLRGLLGASLVGFHTKAYAENFLATCQTSGSGVVVGEEIILADRVVRATNFPLGIDYNRFAEATKTTATQKEYQKLKKKYRGKKIILTVDRLDPTKGFIERLQAYRDFLVNNPKFHRKVVMYMLMMPSRDQIAAYKKLKVEVDQLIKDIETQFKSPGWNPIDKLYGTVPFDRLSALYLLADVAFVSPLRDGMNLVAKEYVASKSGQTGVLILSKNAGAALELTEALLVNPKKPLELSSALEQALTMPKIELKKRLHHMQKQIAANTVQLWSRTFIKTLKVASNTSINFTKPLRKSNQEKLISDYQKSKHRLLLLDYDGVLVPFTDDPLAARPNDSTIKLLKKLGLDKRNDVVIISGRSQEALDAWLGKLPVSLAGEHGAAMRIKGDEWRETIKAPRAWKEIIRPTLEKYATRAPGSFIEEKNYSLVWHFRKTSPYNAQKYTVLITRTLGPIAKKFGLKLYSGNKIIEIKSPYANKGSAAKFFHKVAHDFILAIGDDFTDEDMFSALPKDARTIKVGPGVTKAAWRLSKMEKVLDLLEKLAKP